MSTVTVQLISCRLPRIAVTDPSDSCGSPLEPGAGTVEGMNAPQKVVKSDAEWKAELDPAAYRVLRQSGTEPAFTGEYTDTTATGVYNCRACGAELFRSDAKFASHCGWPSFYAPSEADNVVLVTDRTFGSVRTEVRCASCDSHLGHVFTGEGYPTPTDQRWCINSVSLRLEPTATPAP